MPPCLSFRTGLFCLCLAVLAAPVAFAQIMLSPAAVAGTDLGSVGVESMPENMINHSGVETPFTSGETSFDTYFAVPRLVFAMNGGTNNWMSQVVFSVSLQGYVDFDLGSSRLVRKLAVWNVTGKNVAVKMAEDLASLESAPVVGEFILTDHWSFPFSYPVDVLSFPAPHPGRYLRLEIRSTYPLGAGLNFAYAIIGEVVASVAPPPATLSIAATSEGGVTVTFPGTLLSSPKLDGP